MKLARLFFKPRWQHADESVRAAAVAELDDAELTAALPRIVLEDPSVRVRRAALSRLDRLDFYARAASDDADSGLRAEAALRIRERIARGDGLSEDERLRWLARSEDLELVDYVLQHGSSSALRMAALQRCRRPGRIAECALADPDPELRLAAVERIGSAASLQRIAEEARRKDKRVSRRARERLEEMQGSQNPRRQLEQAEACCSQLETALARVEHEGLSALLAGVDQQWQSLEESARAPLMRRYQGLRELLQHILCPPAPEPEAAAAQSPEPGEDQKDQHVQELLRLLAELAASPAEQVNEARISRLHQVHDVLSAGLDRAAISADLQPILDEAAARVQAWRAQQPLLAPLTELLARAEAWASREPLPDANEIDALASEWTRAWKRMEWRGGEADAARERLQDCVDQARTALARLAAHRAEARAQLPDALDGLASALDANDLGQARAAMARMQQLRELAGERGASARLQALEQRLRELADWEHWSHAGLRQRLLDDVLALPGQSLHPDALATRVRELQTEWQRLDALEHDPARPGRRAGGALGRRFRDACHSVLEPAQGFFDKRDALRTQRVDALEALLTRCSAIQPDAEPPALLALRKELIEALRGLGELDPRRRKPFATRLREQLAVIDARLDARNSDAEQQRRQLLEAAVLAAGNPDIQAAVSEIKALQARWKTLPRGRRSSDNSLWEQFRDQADAVFARLGASREQQQRERELRMHQASLALDALIALPTDSREALDTARHSWQQQRPALLETAAEHPALKTRVAELERRLDQARLRLEQQQRTARLRSMLAHFTAAAAGGDADPAAVDQARRCLLNLEILAAVESPEAERPLRREVQVQRLADRLGGEQTATMDEAAALIERMSTLSAGLDASTRVAMAQRLENVLQRLEG